MKIVPVVLFALAMIVPGQIIAQTAQETNEANAR